MEWKTKLAEKSKPLTDFLFFLAKRAQNDMIFRVASSLAYTSLIALVPLFAIGLAIFSAFPVFEAVRSQVEEFIFQNLTPEFEQEVSSYFAAIVKNAGQLTTIGVVGIAVLHFAAVDDRKQFQLYFQGNPAAAHYHQNYPLLDGDHAGPAFARHRLFDAGVSLHPAKIHGRRRRNRTFLFQLHDSAADDHFEPDAGLCAGSQQKGAA